MNDSCCSKPPSHIPSFFAILGFFLLFAGILMVTYVPHSPTDPGSERAAYRKETRLALDAAMHKESSTYGWADKTLGQVRLPIAQAIPLTLEAYQKNVALFTPTP